MTSKESGEQMFKAGVIPANVDAQIPKDMQIIRFSLQHCRA